MLAWRVVPGFFCSTSLTEGRRRWSGKRVQPQSRRSAFEFVQGLVSGFLGVGAQVLGFGNWKSGFRGWGSGVREMGEEGAVRSWEVVVACVCVGWVCRGEWR